jgi:hypothetical protein
MSSEVLKFSRVVLRIRPLQFGLVGIGDGVNDEVDRGPARGQLLERGIKRCVVGHVYIDHEIGPDALCKGFKPLAERLALVGKGKLRPGLVHGFRDAPG